MIDCNVGGSIVSCCLDLASVETDVWHGEGDVVAGGIVVGVVVFGSSPVSEVGGGIGDVCVVGVDSGV